MKLAKKHAKIISTLFNTVQCAHLMMKEAGNDADMYNRWYDTKTEAIKTLLDEYGIVVH